MRSSRQLIMGLAALSYQQKRTPIFCLNQMNKLQSANEFNPGNPTYVATEDAYAQNSRVDAFLSGKKSLGVSCNTYALQDSIESIASGHAWAYQVMAYQGAPSIDFSNLRPANYELSTGGTSSGAISFMRPLDSIVSTMRRSEKKNGAGIAYLDWKHPELDAFLAADFQQLYKAIYLPSNDSEDVPWFLSQTEFISKLAKAYNEFNCFLVKRPLPTEDGESLYVNLCTEVEIPHRGGCVLGAHNLGKYDLNTIDQLPNDFVRSALRMNAIKETSMRAIVSSPLNCSSPANNQFGLSLFGLSSLLGKEGITYESFSDALGYLVSGADDFREVEYRYDSLHDNLDDAINIAYYLVFAYHAAAIELKAVCPELRAAFCIQPTVSTAQRSFDNLGYHVSPEIQPVVGLKTENGVETIVKSAVKGDKRITYHPYTWTIDEVPYDVYARTSGFWQEMMNLTGLAHRHSHCYYGDNFTSEDIVRWYTKAPYKHIQSYYYRLNVKSNVVSLDKAKLWQEVEKNELYDDDALESFINKYKNKQMRGTIECACEN